MSSIPVRYDDPWLEDVEAEGREAQWVESVLEGLAEQGYTRGEEVALTPRLVQSVLRLWDNTVLGEEEEFFTDRDYRESSLEVCGLLTKRVGTKPAVLDRELAWHIRDASYQAAILGDPYDGRRPPGDDHMAVNRWAVDQVEAGKYQEALEALTSIKEKISGSDKSLVRRNLAGVYRNLGELEQACHELQENIKDCQAVGLIPEPRDWMTVTEVHAKQGEADAVLDAVGEGLGCVERWLSKPRPDEPVFYDYYEKVAGREVPMVREDLVDAVKKAIESVKEIEESGVGRARELDSLTNRILTIRHTLEEHRQETLSE